MTPERFAHLERLFAEAIALDGAARTAFLDRLSDDDPRAELEELLRTDARSQDQLANAISGLARTPAPGEDNAAPAWEGRVIGAYRLIREIGRGGMSIVFEAAREGDFAQRVALKISTLAPFSQPLLERFRQERRILAGLEHPHIARLIDGGSTSEGLPYFVTEYCEGETLDRYLERANPGLRAACELFLKICSAVEYAHQNLIVHRDLKPANVLVDAAGNPKLIDFGIAKLLDLETGQTQTAIGPGTPSYTAPEQILGRPVTTRTDIYQLGLLLFEMLTRRRAQVVEETSLAALQRSICEVALPLASSVPGRQALRGDLDVIIATATQKDPERRYRSVATLADDLRAHLDSRPIQARADSTAYRVGRFLRRNRLTSAAVALAVLALLGGVAATTYQARLAERRFTQVRGIARALLYDVQGAVQVLPASVEAQQVVVRTALNYLNGLSAEAGGDESLQLEIAAGYARTGSIQANVLGSSLEQRAAGQGSFQKALDILEPLNARRPGDAAIAAELAGVYAALAEIDVRSSRAALARERTEKGIAVMERAVAANPNDRELSLRLARAYVQFNRDIAGRAKVDLSLVQKPIALLEPLLRQSPNDLALVEDAANAYAAAVAAHFNAHQAAVARPFAEQALALRERLVAAQPNSAPARRALMLANAALGDLHWGFPYSLGDRDKAIAYYAKMLEPAEWLREREPGKRSTRTDLAMARMRYASAMPPKDERAVALLQESLAAMEEIVREDPSNAGVGRQQIDLCLRLAARWSELGKEAEAERYLRRGLQVGESLAVADAKNLGARTWGVRAYIALGRQLVRTGRRAEALALIPRAEARAAEAMTLDQTDAGGGLWPGRVAAWAAELRNH
jgi:tetratricopeptide (TPR) repeat protein